MTYSKCKRSSIFVLVFIFFGLQGAFAQDVENHNKNSVYAGYGTVIFASQASISYERLLLKKEKYETRAKLNYGVYLSNNFDYDTNAKVYENYLSVSAVQLIGLFEINAGVAYANFKLDEGFAPDPEIDYTTLMNSFTFYGNIGIRYSKNHFLLRAGVGNLELLYFGIGLNF